MLLPKQNYSLDSFLEKIANSPDEIFGTDEQRQWLKIYLMVADDNWVDLFREYDPVKLGEIYHIPMPFGEDGNRADYYVHELERGLLMFFTSTKREDYNQTLQHFVRHHNGITEMWLPPTSFDDVITYIQSTYDANIYSFTAIRTWSSKQPAKIRGDFSRMIRYSGDDADYSLKELREQYGVVPTLIDFKIDSDKLRVTNVGMFLVRSINSRILRIIQEVVDKVIGEQRRLRTVSKQVEYTTMPMEVGQMKMNVSSLMAGKIMLNNSLNASLIDKLFQNFKDEEFGRTNEVLDTADFSFIDTNLSEDSLSFSATVVDEDKGTIFGLSGNEKNMVLIPKHRTTFESFINFYRLINEKIDQSSNLFLFSENIAR